MNERAERINGWAAMIGVIAAVWFRQKQRKCFIKVIYTSS